MAIILGIETATGICSVALSKDGRIIAVRESEGGNEHSALLTAYISEVVSESTLQLSDIDAVAVSMGPGSYTGLRIGVSTAKGLCYALGKPFIAVDTLTAIAWQMKESVGVAEAGNSIVFCPMIDARRMEVYTAAFDGSLRMLEPVNAAVIDENSLNNFEGSQLYLAGDGAGKCADVFSGRSDIHFLNGIAASAKSVCYLSESKFAAGEFADTAYCEPFYLKDFIPGKARVKGLE